MTEPVAFQFESLPGVQLHYVPGMGAPVVLMDGERLERKGTKLIVPRPEGDDVGIGVTTGGFDFSSPVFVLGDERVRPLPPLPIPLLIAVFMPMGLTRYGIAGAGIALVVLVANLWMARFMSANIWVRAACIVACSAVAALGAVRLLH